MDETTQSNQTNIYITGNGGFNTLNGTEFNIEQKQGISPRLYFKYVKSKFGLLGGMRLEKRIKRLWKLAEESEKNGQIALSEEFLKKVLKETRESEMYAMGYKIFIENEHLEKFQYKVKDKSVSITPLKNYIKVIPDDCQKKINKAIKNNIFDEIIIVHYDPTGVAVKRTEEEERKDPIAFGKIKESTRMYFITDWEDEYCDLTLDDIVDKLKLEDDEITLSKNPTL